MKKYQELEIEILVFTEQDVVTASGFAGKEHKLGNPNVNEAIFSLGRLED